MKLNPKLALIFMVAALTTIGVHALTPSYRGLVIPVLIAGTVVAGLTLVIDCLSTIMEE